MGYLGQLSGPDIIIGSLIPGGLLNISAIRAKEISRKPRMILALAKRSED